MIINFVSSGDLRSRIFCDIFQRFIDRNGEDRRIVVSDRPIDDADLYHYHRVHLEDEIRHPAAVTVHHDPTETDGWLKPERFLRHLQAGVMRSPATSYLVTQGFSITDDSSIFLSNPP